MINERSSKTSPIKIIITSPRSNREDNIKMFVLLMYSFAVCSRYGGGYTYNCRIYSFIFLFFCFFQMALYCIFLTLRVLNIPDASDPRGRRAPNVRDGILHLIRTNFQNKPHKIDCILSSNSSSGFISVQDVAYMRPQSTRMTFAERICAPTAL